MRVACPLCLQEITMPLAPQQPARSQQALGHGIPVPPTGSLGVKKNSMMLLYAIIGAVVLILAAGCAIYAFHGGAQTESPAPASVATDSPSASSTVQLGDHVSAPVTMPVTQPAPQLQVSTNQAIPAGSFDLAVGHVILNGNGYQEIFTVNTTNGYLEYKFNTGVGTVWGSWTKIGSTGGFAGRPAAICGADGAVNVFVLNNEDHSTAHFSRTSFTNDWNENSLGGNAAGDPAVIINTNLYMEVFVTELDGSLSHNWSTNGGSSWNGWVVMGTGSKGRPTAVVRVDGGAEVFVRCTNNTVQHYYHPGFSSKWKMGTQNGGNFASDPWAVQAADSSMEVFCIKLNGTLWRDANRGTGTSWNGWSRLNTGVVLLTNDLFATVNKQGDTEVFARQASDGNTGYLVDVDNQWSHWQTVDANQK
jgi:hypothetical protein